ncbi:MAG: hypothetical protein IJM97_07400 [Clostridia bacterium]|nr:hypothetical protein [Clostridia bacterium]
MYEVIVLGATFLSAGIAQTMGGSCLVLERRTQAFYEFTGALNFGTSYDKKLVSEEAENFRKIFEERNIFANDRVCLFEISAPSYKFFEGKNILFNTEIISIEKEENCFVCTTHGADGFNKFKAKRIVDTRVSDSMCDKKTYNILLHSDNGIDSDSEIKKWGRENNFVMRCPVDLNDNYYQARQKAKEIIEKLPEDTKAVLLAESFDYQVKSDYPKIENSIVYMPSKAYENPLLSFDAGVCYGKEIK